MRCSAIRRGEERAQLSEGRPLRVCVVGDALRLRAVRRGAIARLVV
jgi:hypothetical protein